MDQYGYPSDKELRRIKRWDITKKGIEGLIELIHSAWNHQYGAMRRKEENDELREDEKLEMLELVTGGWSGNEDVMEAVLSNKWFNYFCWEESRRGGYYKFELKKCFPLRSNNA